MEEEIDLEPLKPLSRFKCAIRDDDSVAFTSATSGEVLYTSMHDLMLSTTLKAALDCQEDIETEFTVPVPHGYLEAWVECRGCASEAQLGFEFADVLARYLQASDFLADSDMMVRVGRVLGSKLLAGSTSTSGQLDRIKRPFFKEQEALQVLCSLSPEAIHTVLGHCRASLNRQLIEFPKSLHGDAVQAAFPHMFAGGRLELNCKHYQTAILAAILNHNKRLKRASCLLLKNFAVRDTGPHASPLPGIEAALHSAVRGGITKLSLDGCDMPLEFFRRLLATLVQNPELDSLDMSFCSYIHSKSSATVKRSIPFHLFTDYQVLQPLARLTSLQSLSLSTVHPSGDGGHLGLSPFIIVSSQTVGLSLSRALCKLTNLTHLSISHAMDPSEAATFLPYLSGLQSLHIGIIHHNSIAVDDCGPLLYQVPSSASSSLAGAFRGLKCLRRLSLNAPALKVPDDTCFRQSAGARAQWFPGFYAQGTFRDAFQCSTAVSVLSSCKSDLQQLSVVLPCSQREAHAGTIELTTAVTKMTSLEAFCVSQIRSPENLCMLARAMLSPTYAFLSQLRFEDAFFAPDTVEVADPGRMERTTSAACCQIYKLLPQLPSLLEFGMHFSDPTVESSMHPNVTTCNMLPRLQKLDLNVNIRDRFGAPLIVGNLLSLCAHADLHTLLLSLESGVMRAVSTEDYLISRLQLPLAAATCLRHLQIKFRHDELRSFQRLRNSLSGLTCLTCLSLDLKCSNYCMEKLSSFFASLVPLVDLQTLQLTLYRNLPLRGPCADLQPRSGMVISPACEESLSVALWSMTQLRVLRMYGWCFGPDCLQTSSPLSAVLSAMTQLEELEINCGEVRGGSIIKMLSKSLQSPRKLQKLVAGPWNLVQDNIRTLKRYILGTAAASYVHHVYMKSFVGLDSNEDSSLHAELIQGVPGLRQVDISNCTINTYAVPILGSLLRTVTHLTDFTAPDREISDDDAIVISKAFVDDAFRFQGLWNLPERQVQRALKDQAKEIPSMYPTEDTNYIGHSSRSMESIAPKPVGMLDTDVQWFYNG